LLAGRGVTGMSGLPGAQGPSGSSSGYPASPQPQVPLELVAHGGVMPSALGNLPVPQMLPFSMPSFGVAPSGSPGLGDRLGAGLMGFANGAGPIAAVANLIGGIATGQRQDPYGMALQRRQQSQAQTYQALRQADIPDAAAQAAALNPDIVRAIAPHYLQPRLPTFGGRRPG